MVMIDEAPFIMILTSSNSTLADCRRTIA
jgi:hypothetical protein